MSNWLDQIKHNMQQQLSKVYKEAKTKSSEDDFNEFQSWFWKIRPLLNVDLSVYNKSEKETSGPNIHPIIKTE